MGNEMYKGVNKKRHNASHNVWNWNGKSNNKGPNKEFAVPMDQKEHDNRLLPNWRGKNL